MTLIDIKQKLHQYLDVADERKVKAIFALLENDIYDIEYSDELKSELDSRLKSYHNGEKMISASDSKAAINKILQRN